METNQFHPFAYYIEYDSDVNPVPNSPAMEEAMKPKPTFESVPIEDRKNRLIAEVHQTAERMNRLNKFMGSDDFPKLDRIDKDLLYEQQRAMSTLLQIYGKRIDRLGGKFSHEEQAEAESVAAYPPPESEWPEKPAPPEGCEWVRMKAMPAEPTEAGAPKYRILKVGEIAQYGDQLQSSITGKWQPFHKSPEPYKIVENHVPHRRPI